MIHAGPECRDRKHDVDTERIIGAARERGCFLEINSEPDRLDLNEVHAQAAKSAGVKIDCHFVSLIAVKPVSPIECDI